MFPSSLHIRAQRKKISLFFLHTTQDSTHVIIYDVIFPLSPCFLDWNVLVSLAIAYTEVASFFCFYISPSLNPFQVCYILFEVEGPKYAQYSRRRYMVDTPWKCLAYAKDIFHRPEGMGFQGYEMFMPWCALCCTVLRGLCWPCLSLGDAWVHHLCAESTK